ncbi:hypothetical protein Peur_030423 [Populus x canadensis]
MQQATVCNGQQKEPPETSTSSFIRLHQRLSHSSSARPAVADSTESSGSSSSTVTPFHDFCTVSSSGRSLSPAASSFSSSSNSALLSTIVDLSI